MKAIAITLAILTFTCFGTLIWLLNANQAKVDQRYRQAQDSLKMYQNAYYRVTKEFLNFNDSVHKNCVCR